MIKYSLIKKNYGTDCEDNQKVQPIGIKQRMHNLYVLTWATLSLSDHLTADKSLGKAFGNVKHCSLKQDRERYPNRKYVSVGRSFSCRHNDTWKIIYSAKCYYYFD